MTSLPAAADPYTGLRQAKTALPAYSYYSQEAYDRDLRTIWYRSWINVCRSSDLAGPRAYRLERIGTQEILLLRDEDGILRAFHNTCRHRGSALCSESSGRLKGRLLVCPYHSWSYSQKGDLVRAPSKELPQGFDRTGLGLYAVAVEEWRGFVFINLDKEPQSSVAETFDAGSADLGNWPLETLAVGHRYVKRMACNWKIFWENFNECLHCPNVHPELSDLVPIYGRGLMSRHDDPRWADHADDSAPKYSGRLRDGAESWSSDGRASAPAFPQLSPSEREAGQSYATHLPSVFVVGHIDYVRTVRLRPLGPEETELTAEWLFDAKALARGEVDLDNAVAFPRLVLDQDASICETNQRGLKSIRHEAGILMPEEYELHRFHNWIRERTGGYAT